MTVKNPAEISKLTFEQALSELEGIVAMLESGEAGLDESMEIYARGQQLKEFCNSRLAAARLQVEKITSDNDGNIILSAFNPAD